MGGSLHDGHLDLVRQARAENDVVIVSIYVNPTQFAPTDDLDQYPRELENDVEKLAAVDTDAVFAPCSSLFGETHNTWIVPESDGRLAEGSSRPGFFQGVATVVTKLFNIVNPTRSYFGQKDAQQLMVVESLVRDLNMQTEVIGVPTVRESDGLAMSSRNSYMSEKERSIAPVMYRALRAAQACIQHSDGDCTVRSALGAALSVFREEPSVDVEYVSVSDSALNELHEDTSIRCVGELRGTVSVNDSDS